MFVSVRTCKNKFHSPSIRKDRFPTPADLKPAQGFTLIEILIVISIIGILAAIAIPHYNGRIDDAKVASAKIEIKTVEREILGFSIEKGRFPDDLSEIDLGNMLDPYGRPYQYHPSTYIDEEGNIKDSTTRRKAADNIPVNTDFDLFSMGRDGESAETFTEGISSDDIVRANNGMFIGLVSAY